MRIRPASRRIAILLSGRGSNFSAIADRIDAGRLNAEVALVVSNRESAPGLEEARRRGLDTVCLPSKGVQRETFDRQVAEHVRSSGASLVCLAGFMRILSPVLVEAFPWAILNIHPSLLPAFPGLEPQRQALEHGVRFSGCTVHFVDTSLDGGPIAGQRVVPVEDDDTVETLSARILAEEHRLYSDVIDRVLAGRCEIRGRRVVMHGPPAELLAGC